MPRRIRTNVSKDYARLALFVFPENKEFLRGKRQRLMNHASAFATLFSLFFVIVSLVLVGVAVFFGYRHYQLTHNADTTTGALIDYEYNSDTDGDSYMIRYAYAIDGQRYERRDQVSQGVYNEIVGGAAFYVTLNLDEPEVATIGEPSLLGVGISSGFAIIFSFVSWAMFLGTLRQGTLAKHLSERGLLLEGEVVRARGRIDIDDDDDRYRRRQDKDLTLEVWYSFVSPKTQKTIKGKIANSRPELHASRGHIGRTPGIFAPGDPLLVMYADDRRHTAL